MLLPETGEIVIGTVDGMLKVRTVKRQALEEDKWNVDDRKLQ